MPPPARARRQAGPVPGPARLLLRGVRHALQPAAAALAAAAVLAGPAQAFGPVSIRLDDLQVAEVACAKGQLTAAGSGRDFNAHCLEISAESDNPSKKALLNADVFGRVFDAVGDAVTDVEENGRIAYIPRIEPGKSTVKFPLIVSDLAFSRGKLDFQAVKVSGFPGGVLPGQGSGNLANDLLECDEFDSSCDPDNQVPF